MHNFKYIFIGLVNQLYGWYIQYISNLRSSFLNSFLYAVDNFFVFHREYHKKQVKKERTRKRTELIKAWKLLDVLGNGK